MSVMSDGRGPYIIVMDKHGIWRANADGTEGKRITEDEMMDLIAMDLVVDDIQATHAWYGNDELIEVE
jgi:hypothetical protein